MTEIEERLGASGKPTSHFMIRKLSRRLGVLERMTDREVAGIRAAYPDSKCILFVMVCPRHRHQDSG